jgi:hypothetical protein
MLNQTYRKVFILLGLSLLLIMGSGASVAAAAPIEPFNSWVEAVPPPAQEGDEDEETTVKLPVVNPVEAAEDMRVLFEETTFVHLLWEQYGYAATACAGNGLNNIQPSAEGLMVLIPNAGDLSLFGSNVSVKLEPTGEITFIPRVQGQMIRVPINIGDKVEGQEVLSLTLDEGKQLMAAGLLVWTAKDHGPFGNGHGLPGHIATCDPLFNEEQYKEFAGVEEDEES